MQKFQVDEIGWNVACCVQYNKTSKEHLDVREIQFTDAVLSGIIT